MARKKTTRGRKKKKKTRSSSKKASSLDPVVKRIIVLIAVCAVLATGIFLGIRYFFMNSDYFTVDDIIVNADHTFYAPEVRKRIDGLYGGRNIFSVDVVQAELLLRDEFPNLKKVVVNRRMPDIVEVDIISREPAAVIDSGGGIVVDTEGVVLNVGDKGKDLVKIKGLNFFLNVPARGEKVGNIPLGKAMVLLAGLKKTMRADIKGVDYIDISDKNNIILGIYGVEVKMGDADYLKKLGKLREIVKDPNINMRDIRYIDLRFEDAVISPK